MTVDAKSRELSRTASITAAIGKAERPRWPGTRRRKKAELASSPPAEQIRAINEALPGVLATRRGNQARGRLRHCCSGAIDIDRHNLDLLGQSPERSIGEPAGRVPWAATSIASSPPRTIAEHHVRAPRRTLRLDRDGGHEVIPHWEQAAELREAGKLTGYDPGSRPQCSPRQRVPPAARDVLAQVPKKDHRRAGFARKATCGEVSQRQLETSLPRHRVALQPSSLLAEMKLAGGGAPNHGRVLRAPQSD